MRLKIDWRRTILATAVLLVLSALLNLAFIALYIPAVLLPLGVVAGGILFSVSRTPRRRDTIRNLLQDQKKIAKSFLQCLFDEE